MIRPEDVPYADPEPLPELVEECRCVEAECAAHGVDLHPGRRHDALHAAGPVPVVIGDRPRRLVADYPDYGG